MPKGTSATVGFCLFDRDHDGRDDHGMSPDLCLSNIGKRRR